MTTTQTPTPCTCTEPYSQHVEPMTRAATRRASHVDAYARPLHGSRSVFRCRHGHEMRWDDASGQYHVLPAQ